MTADEAPDIVEHVSAVPFDATLQRLTAAIARAALILFSRIDHQAGARDAGLEMLFLLALLLGQLRHLRACCPFRVSSWAVSFPLAASSIAGLRFAAAQPGIVTDTIALLLLALATLVIAALLGRTVLGLLKGEIRTLST